MEEQLLDDDNYQNVENEEEAEKTIDPKHMRNMQIINVVIFIVAMAFNASFTAFGKKGESLGKITRQMDLHISPAGFAFSIWAVIYTLLSVFVVYQALPNSLNCVKNRNNNLIFTQIGYLFAWNMAFNSVWLIIFVQNTAWAFGLAQVTICAMLYTAIQMMRYSTRTEVNKAEGISIRGGFSLYSGWLTVASILNFAFFLKSVGVTGDLSLTGILMLWAAFIIFNVLSIYDRNPLYSLVFIWALFGIQQNNLRFKSVEINCKVLLVAQSFMTVCLFARCFVDSHMKKGKFGLLY